MIYERFFLTTRTNEYSFKAYNLYTLGNNLWDLFWKHKSYIIISTEVYIIMKYLLLRCLKKYPLVYQNKENYREIEIV